MLWFWNYLFPTLLSLFFSWTEGEGYIPTCHQAIYFVHSRPTAYYHHPAKIFLYIMNNKPPPSSHNGLDSFLYLHTPLILILNKFSKSINQSSNLCFPLSFFFAPNIFFFFNLDSFSRCFNPLTLLFCSSLVSPGTACLPASLIASSNLRKQASILSVCRRSSSDWMRRECEAGV